jgi:transposase
MRPSSRDLRQRVAAAVTRREGALRQIARRFVVSLSFLTPLLRRRRQTGSLDPEPQGGGHPPALKEADREHLRQLVKKQPDATREELRPRWGVPCSRRAIWRALVKLNRPRKKKVRRTREQGDPKVQEKRRAFQAKGAALDPEGLVFGDESGVTRAMTRAYGRAPRGERVVGEVPGKGTTVTVVSAVRLSGVGATLAFEGARDTAAFRTSVEAMLAPPLRPGDGVIWDNRKPHQDAQVGQAVEQGGASVEPRPPWRPDRTPIEKRYSKVKEFLRSVAARRTEAVTGARGEALRAVRPRNLLGWFRSWGLSLPTRGAPPKEPTTSLSWSPG